MGDTCPKCNGNLYRHNTGIKICVKCGNKVKSESLIPGPNHNLTQPRIEKIKLFHAKNKNYNQKQLRAFVPETEYMISKYWKQYVTGANNDRT